MAVPHRVLCCHALSHELFLRTLEKVTQFFFRQVCIHQTDAKIKAASISNLDAYADTFVILDYLERLWTVYDCGSVLVLQESPNIVNLPVLTLNQVLGFLLVTDFAAASGVHAAVRSYAVFLVHMTSFMLATASSAEVTE